MKCVFSSPWMTGFGLAAVISLAAASTATAQEPLTKAKALYDAAAYEDALTVLSPVDAPEAQQYKALCLLALGRSSDALGAVERLVNAQPTFEPSSQDVPPRFVTLVSDAKRKLLPAIARRAFNEGREQFRNGSREEAMRRFDLVLALTSDASFKQSADAEDLRTLAAGFIDLAKAATPAPATAPEPAPATPKPSERARAEAPAIVQPVVVKQFIPPVPAELNGQGNRTLSLRIVIGTNGRVSEAAVVQSAHPLYDRVVLQATRDWVYEPATMNGKAVASEKIVTVQLR
jgi:TonB family protein